jgi:uncharacterized protein
MNDIWINLPVRDVHRSKQFFKSLGFTFNENIGNQDRSACMIVGQKNVVVMLFDEPTFRSFTNMEIADPLRHVEVLLSVGAQSKEEVDELAQKAVEAGGTSSHKPYEMVGNMYGCVFADLDGHRWNVLYMKS